MVPPSAAISDLKPCSARNPIRFSSSAFWKVRAEISIGRSTSSFSKTSWRERRACSAKLIKFSRRFGCFMLSAPASKLSKSPNWLISSAAVFTPMPGTPGTLSVESPANACTSTTLSGVTPNFSTTSSAPIGRFFMGSSMVISPRTNCIKSLSEETIKQGMPCFSAFRA